MNLGLATVLAAVLTSLVGLLVVWRSNRVQYANIRREQTATAAAAAQVAAAAATQATDRLINQLQEERADIKKSLTQAHNKIDTLSLRQRYWEDYANVLRAHIEAGNPPPPPAYPAGLLRID